MCASTLAGTRSGLELFQVEVREVWLDQPDAVVLEPEEFAAAAPVDCPRYMAHALQLSHAGHC